MILEGIGSAKKGFNIIRWSFVEELRDELRMN
jgi:hypothetical protein